MRLRPATAVLAAAISAASALAAGHSARAEGLTGQMRDLFVNSAMQSCQSGMASRAKEFTDATGLGVEKYCSCVAAKVADGTDPAELTPDRIAASTETIKRRSVDAAAACLANRP